jgi:transcriptional regulator with GAF, ATPase, and Fis domain
LTPGVVADAWVTTVGGRAEKRLPEALQRLSSAGVEPSVLAGAPAGYGIVLFDALTDELLDTVVRLARGAAGRLLAVGTERESLVDQAAWQLLGAGAADVLAGDGADTWALRAAARLARWRHVDDVAESSEVREQLVGESPQWRAAVRDAVEAATFTDVPVLVTGETGTGKELIARLVHSLDPARRRRELVVVDCTTIVPTLSGSEFFGHERGAFTGAVSARDGAFARADGGTLFLDEVGELPLGLQSELLRVVQEGLYKRVGGDDWKHTSFRLICATNRDLAAEAAAGRFRHDLLYRIAGSTLQLPSLRDRTEDVLLLARHFLREVFGEDDPELDDAVRLRLVTREYPGNVRDLRHLVSRIAYRHVGPGPVTVGELPAEERRAEEGAIDWRSDGFSGAIRLAIMQGATLREIGSAATDVAIAVALAEEGGSLQRAARRLGLTPRALQLRRASGRLPEAAS